MKMPKTMDSTTCREINQHYFRPVDPPERSSITEKTHNELNATIEEIFCKLPNMRLLSKAERRFFKFATNQKVQELHMHRKRQWIRKAESILNNFKAKQHNKSIGNAQKLLRAMGIYRKENTNDIMKRTQKQLELIFKTGKTIIGCVAHT